MASSNSVPSVDGGSLSSTAAHSMVCDMVAAQVKAEVPGLVFLSAEVQDLIRCRLQGDGPGSPAPPPEKGDAADVAGDGPGSPHEKNKKRKLDAGSSAASVAAGVSWTICCMDGTTFSVAMPEGAPVAELKREIGVLGEVPYFTMELFVKDIEEPLDDAKPLRSVDRAPLFMLLKPASDRLALEALFKRCGGEGWEQKGCWMTNANLEQWHAVEVDDEGRVIELELIENNLVGIICPSEVLQLSALQGLNLFGNLLTGAIPAELGQLGALTYLGLDYNELTGPIPAELGQLGALTSLALNSNKLTGPIPSELGQLAELTELCLDKNQLVGPIPAELGQLAALEHLTLHDNQQLTGHEALRGCMEEHNPDCKLEF